MLLRYKVKKRYNISGIIYKKSLVNKKKGLSFKKTPIKYCI